MLVLMVGRRKLTHGEAIQTPARSAQSIIALTLNYKRIKKKGASPIQRHGWMKPTIDFVKLNVDAAYNEDNGTGGTGAVIRDHLGSFVAGQKRSLLNVEDAATAEAWALRDGLALAGDLGCNKLVVEADCMEVVDIMQDGGNSLGAAAAIYEDCSFLCRSFARARFQHCPREANLVAHELARFSEVSQGVWHNDPPDFLVPVIANDVTAVDG